MASCTRPSLLVVLPGRAGRAPVLERLKCVAEINVLVPSSDLEHSQWAKTLVGEDHWIEWTGTTASIDEALSAVQAWSAAGGAAHHIDAVMTYDDFATEICSHLCACLGVPGTPLETTRMLRDKTQFRKRCSEVGVPAVRNTTILTDEDVETVLRDDTMCYPAVLKPVKGGGSWYVCKVNNAAELQQTWERLSAGMSQGAFPHEIREAGFTLEEYFSGHEVDVDGWARDGKLEFCVVSDNRPAIEPHFLEVGGIYPSQLPPPAVAILEQLTAQVVEAFPGIHSCFHFEAKINVDTLEVMPIEFNARVGGAECPASVEAVTGYYLPCEAARLAFNIPCTASEKLHKVVASTNLHRHDSGVLTECSDKEVDAAATKLVTCCLFSAGLPRPHVPNNGSMSCLGWMAAGGDTIEEAEGNLHMAINQARITVVPH